VGKIMRKAKMARIHESMDADEQRVNAGFAPPGHSGADAVASSGRR
jgi:hypothetical protein